PSDFYTLSLHDALPILVVGVLVVFTAAIIPTKNNPEPIRRGLDLKGGTHLVMRVNVGDALRLEVDQAIESLKNQSAKNNLPVPRSEEHTSELQSLAYLV